MQIHCVGHSASGHCGEIPNWALGELPFPSSQSHFTPAAHSGAASRECLWWRWRRPRSARCRDAGCLSCPPQGQLGPCQGDGPEEGENSKGASPSAGDPAPPIKKPKLAESSGAEADKAQQIADILVQVQHSATAKGKAKDTKETKGKATNVSGKKSGL